MVNACVYRYDITLSLSLSLFFTAACPAHLSSDFIIVLWRSQENVKIVPVRDSHNIYPYKIIKLSWAVPCCYCWCCYIQWFFSSYLFFCFFFLLCCIPVAFAAERIVNNNDKCMNECVLCVALHERMPIFHTFQTNKNCAFVQFNVKVLTILCVLSIRQKYAINSTHLGFEKRIKFNGSSFEDIQIQFFVCSHFMAPGLLLVFLLFHFGYVLFSV